MQSTHVLREKQGDGRCAPGLQRPESTGWLRQGLTVGLRGQSLPGGFRTGHGVQKLTPRKLSLDGEGKAAWWRHLAQKGGAERLRGAGRPLSLGRGCGHT